MAVTYLPGRDGIFLGVLRAALQPGDWLAFVGAGDIDHLAHALVARLETAPPGPAAWDELAADLRPQLSGETRLTREEPLAPRTTMRRRGRGALLCRARQHGRSADAAARRRRAPAAGPFPRPRLEPHRAR